ncbi:MAG: DUF748 domain-containing protein [Verrucomicrobia bacterium]|nr:DUF748 domain-containing protein [Verrucomicrobiota bacterium]
MAPPILRGQLDKRLSEQLHRRVTVGRVALNPLTLSLTLESFAIAEPAGGQFIGWRRLFVDFDSFSVLFREWRFQEISLDGFSGKVAVAADGQVNFADLLKTFMAAEKTGQPAKKMWPLLVRHLAINNARLAYSDASQAEPFATDIGPTTVSLRNFHIGGPRQAPGEIDATTESGEAVTWRGTLSLVPLWSVGDLTISKIALKKYAPYYSKMVRFDLRDGRLDLALHYDFSIENGAPALRVSNGRLSIESLQLAKRGAADPVISLKQIELTGMAATYPKITAEAARLVVNGGSVSVQRIPSGIDLVELLLPVLPQAAPTVAMTSAPASAGTAAPIDARVAEISIRDLAITLDDLTTPRPARHELTGLTCDLRGFSLASLSTPMPLGFKARLAPEGAIHAVGTVALAPLKAALTVELANISLPNVSPYAESFANLRVSRGGLTAALNLQAEIPASGSPVLGAQGDVTIEDFAVSDAASVDQLAGWRSLAIKSLDYSSSPAKLLVSEVNWVEPTGRVIVNADGSINLLVALQPAGVAEPVQVALPSAASGKQAAPVSDLMTVALDRFILENAAFEFVDRSIKPNVQLSLNELSGSIEGLSSAELARATVDIKGRVNGSAPVSISGQVNPLSAHAFTDLKVAMKGIALVPVGPYSGKFAGYELAGGNLNLDIRCRVSQRKVDCANVVTIDQFAFGNATNSPDATSLPVRLAVALLRDNSGRIVVDLPVHGSLDDPNFRVGRVVLRVLTNILVKVATSPFSLIGSMFGGEKDQDLSYQQFVAGGIVPENESEMKKLDVVAKALHGRPALRLDIVGGYDETVDGPSLREQALEKEMRLLIWKDRQKLETELTMDQVQVDPQQKMGMVRRLYYHTFPKEKPRTIISTTTTRSNAPVSGLRGNLGAFERAKTTTTYSKTAPKKKAPVAEGETIDVSSLAEGKLPVGGDAKPLTLDEMKAVLLERMTIDDQAARELATQRAQTVYDYLAGPCQVQADRLTLVGLSAETPAAKGARVELRLK